MAEEKKAEPEKKVEQPKAEAKKAETKEKQVDANEEAHAVSTPNVSFKQSTEIASNIRGKKVEEAQKILQAAIDEKAPLAFTKYCKGLGHKPGMGPGRYAPKASKAMLVVLNSAAANAENKGMSNLVVSTITTSKVGGNRATRHGYDGKRARIEVRVKQQ
ncbi:50S ribosomal protein L22 [Candidatus Woesearchaeota archaeon]|nr:50S ribosomal protein L22 [Candidatus Woesearchaeota archaeon]|tara:strand:+ start:528 stop:1007 length:480 start_codon:yes stop_codon:yes gene_type:complete